MIKFANQNNDADNLNIRDMNDFKEIEFLLKETDIGIPFNTNILRIALNQKEEMVASACVAFYRCEIDERMIVRAVKTQQVGMFLKTVWGYN